MDVFFSFLDPRLVENHHTFLCCRICSQRRSSFWFPWVNLRRYQTVAGATQWEENEARRGRREGQNLLSNQQNEMKMENPSFLSVGSNFRAPPVLSSISLSELLVLCKLTTRAQALKFITVNAEPE